MKVQVLVLVGEDLVWTENDWNNIKTHYFSLQERNKSAALGQKPRWEACRPSGCSFIQL